MSNKTELQSEAKEQLPASPAIAEEIRNVRRSVDEATDSVTNLVDAGGKIGRSFLSAAMSPLRNVITAVFGRLGGEVYTIGTETKHEFNKVVERSEKHRDMSAGEVYKQAA